MPISLSFCKNSDNNLSAECRILLIQRMYAHELLINLAN
uniref:Uncharacterized protein n=1 Tax=Arundo donax TaxID=35708 RepID=A0A0A8YIJ4_ARUDO